ncbi:hypothetical protein LguiB_010305 [Lonicera macranthoides]
MATLSPFSSLCSTSTPNYSSSTLSPSSSSSSSSSSLPVRCVRFQSHGTIASSYHPNLSTITMKTKFSRLNRIRSVVEENALIAEAAEGEEGGAAPAAADQPVSVPVSRSDVLTMFFLAEGTMKEAAIPKVKKALEEVEGIADLYVQVEEGIASVELTKETTVQATGVASNLVEIIQGSGFKLHTLNLSFEDEEEEEIS